MGTTYKLTPRAGKRLLTGLVVLLLLPTLWTGYGLAIRVWIAQAGLEVPAVVVDKSRNGSYWVDFEFQADTLVRTTHSLVNHQTWNDVGIGDSIKVWYHPNIEGVALVGQGDVSIRSKAFNLGLVLLMIVLLVLPIRRLKT